MMESNSRDRLWVIVFISCFLGLMVDGMDLMFLSMSLPKLMEDFQLTKVQAGSLGTYTLIGMAVGGFIAGWFADRFGRVRTVVWSILLFSIGTGALAFVQSYWQFAFIRFFSALGLGAEYIVCNTLMAEYVPTRRRTTILGTIQAGWSAGYVLATFLAGLIIPSYGWRFLFLVSLIPVALAVYMRTVIPEPTGWKEVAQAQNATEKRKVEWGLIIADRQALKIFLLWAATCTFLQFGYYGVNNWLPTYLVNELHFNFTKMTGYLVGTWTAMILGKVVTGWLADIFGRRWLYVAGGLLTAVTLPIIVIYHTPSTIIPMLILFGFFYGMPYAVNATYMTESFDTRIRGTAMGGAYNIGRVGATMAPLVIGIIATHSSIGVGLMVMGGSYLLMGILPALFIPEKMYDPYGQKKAGGTAQG
jgi:AAHS family cis,cis-muconate transporter-like MFS transporter